MSSNEVGVAAQGFRYGQLKKGLAPKEGASHDPFKEKIPFGDSGKSVDKVRQVKVLTTWSDSVSYWK